MDSDRWTVVRAAVDRAVRRVGRVHGPEKRVRVSSRQVVLMHCWQVEHDRPMSWACDRRHYGGCFRPRKLLSISQYTRRVKSSRVRWVLQTVHEQLTGCDHPCGLSYLDGKLLPVAMHSKDQQATKVRTNSGYVRGYRLHAWAREDGRIGVWAVTGAHAGEQTVARQLAAHLPPLPTDALVLGDVRFDSAELYRDIANRGANLLTPLKDIAQTPKNRRRMGARLDAVHAWERHPALARMLLRQRGAIERIFGTLCAAAGGLGPLPAWIRTLDRVRRWVGVKIILHNARILARHTRKAAA